MQFWKSLEIYLEILTGADKHLMNWFWTIFTTMYGGEDSWYSCWAKWSVVYRWESNEKTIICPSTFFCSFYTSRPHWNSLEGKSRIKKENILLATEKFWKICAGSCWAFRWTNLENYDTPWVLAIGEPGEWHQRT